MPKKPARTPEQLIDEYRPPRYEHGDRAWMQPAIDAWRKLLTEPVDEGVISRLLLDEATRRAKEYEENRCRLAHGFLRQLGETGTWPFSFDFAGLTSCPIRIGKLKVRIEVAGSLDFDAWELAKQRQQDHENEVAIWERRGARLCNEGLTEYDVPLFADLVAAKTDEGKSDGAA